MTYAIRNSVILLSLMIIIIIVMAVNNSGNLKVLHRVTQEKDMKANILKEIRRKNPDLANEKEIIEEHKRLLEDAEKKRKHILKDDNPTATYDYLTSLSNHYSKKLNFNFVTNEHGQIEATFYNNYTISGDSDIFSIYNFVYQLEEQSALYTIEKFTLIENEKGSIFSDSLHFELKLNVYFDSNGTDMSDISLRKLPYYRISYNPFRFRIYEPEIEDNKDIGIDLDTVKMIGITTNKVFLKIQGHYVQALSIGDEVAYGYLKRIDMKDQLAIFKINKIGLSQEKILKIEKD